VMANLARHAGVDPEVAVEGTNAKFRRRFAHIEARMKAQGRDLAGASLEEMDALWDEAKGLEKAAK
jgi:nucleoside triphosphate diphosphatase